ncbi:MAG: YraN family protein [Chloroflexi bacterium]|nr:YraN family protein [Chloroflexota bacterium]
MTRYNLELGRRGERIAEDHLVKSGAEVLARNYRMETGEIDLVVMQDEDLVAVEVKTRSLAENLESPEEAITRWKLRRIERALASFAVESGHDERHWRIDAIAIEIDLDGGVSRFEHIRDAFGG